MFASHASCPVVHHVVSSGAPALHCAASATSMRVGGRPLGGHGQSKQSTEENGVVLQGVCTCTTLGWWCSKGDTAYWLPPTHVAPITRRLTLTTAWSCFGAPTAPSHIRYRSQLPPHQPSTDNSATVVLCVCVCVFTSKHQSPPGCATKSPGAA